MAVHGDRAFAGNNLYGFDEYSRSLDNQQAACWSFSQGLPIVGNTVAFDGDATLIGNSLSSGSEFAHILSTDFGTLVDTQLQELADGFGQSVAISSASGKALIGARSKVFVYDNPFAGLPGSCNSLPNSVSIACSQDVGLTPSPSFDPILQFPTPGPLENWPTWNPSWDSLRWGGNFGDPHIVTHDVSIAVLIHLHIL